MRNNQKIAEYMPYGVVLDVPAAEAEDEVYTLADNFVFKEGAAVPAAGYSPMVPSIQFRPFAISTVRTPIVYYWIVAGPDGVSVTDGTTETDLTPVGGVSGGVGDWTISGVNNLPLLCGGHGDPPWYWDQQIANAIQPLPNFPASTTAGFIRSFKNFVIVGDITTLGTNFENLIIWSDPVEPGQVPSVWTALPDNLAGDNVLASTEGAIVDGVALRDQFLIFKTHSTYAMRLTGGVGVFEFSELFNSVGILGRNCALEYKAVVYMFTDGDIVVTDGFTVQSIADFTVRKRIFDDMNPDNVDAAFVQVWRKEDQVLFAYPTFGSDYCNKAAVYNTLTRVWGFMNLPNVGHAENGLEIGSISTYTWLTLPYLTWLDWLGTWTGRNTSSTNDALILGQVNVSGGELQAMGKIADVTPVLHSSLLGKHTMSLGDPQRVKIINELWLKIVGFRPDIQLQVRVGMQMNKWDSIAWGLFKTFDYLLQEKIDITATGRFFSIEFRTIETGDQALRIDGFSFRYRFGGRY